MDGRFHLFLALAVDEVVDSLVEQLHHLSLRLDFPWVDAHVVQEQGSQLLDGYYRFVFGEEL